jgi:carbon monoxide dehydrogenase subunit G
MILEGTHDLPGPPDAVWPLLLDPAVIAKAMPGTKELVRTAPDRFRGRMQVTVGPITAAEFDLEVGVAQQVPPETLVMAIDAKGRFGFARGTARVELTAIGPGTRMAYRADLQVGGKIASVGQRLIDVVGRTLLRSGLQALGRELEERLGGAA